jgi:hypothetical protein
MTKVYSILTFRSPSVMMLPTNQPGLLRSTRFQQMQEQHILTTSTIRLFDTETIDQLPWPATTDGAYARAYLTPLLTNGPTHYITNVTTRYMALLIDEQIVLPISLNEEEYTNSYVCSPYSHYVTYAKEELVLIQQRWLKLALKTLIDCFGVFCKWCRINKAVHINNWLLSTNLYPALQPEQLTATLSFLRERFPQHTLILRSLNDYTNISLLEAARQAGCRLVPSRQIYLVEPAKSDSITSKARWLLKRDRALVQKHGYSVVTTNGLEEQDIPRIVEIYYMLYLQKYSLCNPMFTEDFIRLALQEQTLQLVALRKDDRVDAVLGYFCRNGVMTTPLFGYDTDLPLEIGLYRMLSALLFFIAQGNGHVLHESSGAAQFKRNRGAVADIEYSAVYDQNLSWPRRLCWIVLAGILDSVGVPLMKKFRL